MVTLVERVLDLTLEGQRADRALRKVLRDNPQLTSGERAKVATWSLGLCVWRGRIDRLAKGRRALWLPLFLIDRHGWEVDAAARLCDESAEQLASLLAAAPDETELSHRRSLPPWLATRFTEIFGAERADRLAAAMNEPGPLSVRANRLRTTVEELGGKLRDEGVEVEEGRHAPHALTLKGRPNVTGLDAWRQGLFEVQDEGSQLIAEAVEAREEELVIDLCAGAGGKTLALAAAMNDRGRLIAVEPDLRRVADLKGRLGRTNLGCVEVRAGDATRQELLQDLEGRADAVLVDAPCSETGTLRRGPDARWRIDPEAPWRWSKVQRQLLETAARLVRPGGRLVYATCSLDPVENDQVADTLPAVSFSPLGRRTLSPDLDGTDGFFIARWLRR